MRGSSWGRGDAWLFGPNVLAVGCTMYPVTTRRQGQGTKGSGGDKTVEWGHVVSQEPVGSPSGPFWQTVGWTDLRPPEQSGGTWRSWHSPGGV